MVAELKLYGSLNVSVIFGLHVHVCLHATVQLFYFMEF